MIVIAEAGINHNGNLDTAFSLCDAAKGAGADVVKFQMYTMDNLFIPPVLTKKYRELMPVLEKCMFNKYQFGHIENYCDHIGIQFTATPEDIDGADFLIDLGVPFIKVGSRQALNEAYMNELTKRNILLVISRGLGYKDSKCWHSRYIYLLCASHYPAVPKDYELMELYDGISDHTTGIAIGIIAGWCRHQYLEKHLTLDRQQEGPDHFFALEPDMFKIMVDAIREVE